MQSKDFVSKQLCKFLSANVGATCSKVSHLSQPILTERVEGSPLGGKRDQVKFIRGVKRIYVYAELSRKYTLGSETKL